MAGGATRRFGVACSISFLGHVAIMIIAESVANNPVGEALAWPVVALLTPAMLIVETFLNLGHGNALVNLAIVAVSFVLYAAAIWLVLRVAARGKGSPAWPRETNT